MAARHRRMRALAIAIVVLVVALVVTGVFAPHLALDAEFARLRWKAGAVEHRGRAADHDIVFVEAGSGDSTIVFVHGYTGSKENFLALMPELPGRRLLAPD